MVERCPVRRYLELPPFKNSVCSRVCVYGTRKCHKHINTSPPPPPHTHFPTYLMRVDGLARVLPPVLVHLAIDGPDVEARNLGEGPACGRV